MSSNSVMLPALATLAAVLYGGFFVRSPAPFIKKFIAFSSPPLTPGKNIGHAIQEIVNTPLGRFTALFSAQRTIEIQFEESSQLPAMLLTDCGEALPLDSEVMHWYILEESVADPTSWRWVFGVTATERFLVESREIYAVAPGFPPFRWAFSFNFAPDAPEAEFVTAMPRSPVRTEAHATVVDSLPLSWSFPLTRCIDCHGNIRNPYALAEILGPDRYMLHSRKPAEVSPAVLFYHYAAATGRHSGMLEIRRSHSEEVAIGGHPLQPDQWTPEGLRNWMDNPVEESMDLGDDRTISFVGHCRLYLRTVDETIE